MESRSIAPAVGAVDSALPRREVEDSALWWWFILHAGSAFAVVAGGADTLFREAIPLSAGCTRVKASSVWTALGKGFPTRAIRRIDLHRPTVATAAEDCALGGARVTEAGAGVVGRTLWAG